LTATDYAGNTSTTVSRSFSLVEVSPSQPLWNSAGTFAVTSVLEQRNPFFSAAESHKLMLTLDASNMRASAPPSQVVFALSRRVIYDPDTNHEVWRSTVAAEVSIGSADQVLLGDSWNGMDSTLDQMAALWRAYPVDVEILVGRHTGARCAAGETRMLLTGADLEALMHTIPEVNWPVLPQVCLSTTVQWWQSTAGERLRPITNLPVSDPDEEFDLCWDEPMNCIQAHQACLQTKMADLSYGNRCGECNDKCTGNVKEGRRPAWGQPNMDGLICDYWRTQYRSIPTCGPGAPEKPRF
jgi:hypothetical protein